MGVVYVAYDPELDRKIALKIVQASPGVLPNELGGLSRLLREAQAMARVSHPNVVQVYDVGVLGDRLYIAMELVQGRSLSDWLTAPRRWRDVVNIFVDAAHGLAAAHRAGLVHRDFKPDNVLVADDGRARVLDFGLARAVDGAGPTHEGAAELPTTGAVLSSRLTHAGTILGTPAYMAPEQLTGAEVDARADIFALCVALYEALYGERPFAGETFEDLRHAVIAGQVREPSKPPRQLPARIRRTLLKGLRVAPRDRFADIDALIAELAADPGRRWRRIGGTIGVAALAALAAGSLVRGGDRANDLCRGDMIRVQTIWSDARQDQIGRAFIASGAPAAAETWEALRRVFERDLDHWRRSYRDTCEATHVRGEQSPALLDLRMRCLDRHLQELDSLAEIFTVGDPQVVARGLDAFAGISAISRCDEPGALMSQRSGPTDPAEAAAVERLRRALIDGEAYARAGRYDEARRRIDELCAQAERLEFPPLLAEAYLLRGRVERDLDDPSSAAESLLRALTLARAHDHPDVARDATIDLIGVVDASQPRTGESELLVRLAEAELTATPSAAAHARLLEQRGELRWRQGRYDEAIEQLEASVERTRAIYGDHHPAAARARIRLGRSLWTRGQHERSQEHLARGRATLEELLGGDHPELAGALRQEGNAYWVTGGYDRALPLYERALAIAERHDMHVEATKLLNNIAATYGKIGRLADSRAALERVVDRYERLDRLGVDSGDRETALDNLIASYLLKSTPETWPLAQPLIERLDASRRRALPPDHPDHARTMLWRGTYQLQTGDLDGAIVTLSAARELRLEVPDTHPILLARALSLLAQALIAAERDRPRAAAYAAQAAELFHAEGDYGAVELAALDAWRREAGLLAAGGSRGR
jgi:tetratricopeptide (TPR) repeat protein